MWEARSWVRAQGWRYLWAYSARVSHAQKNGCWAHCPPTQPPTRAHLRACSTVRRDFHRLALLPAMGARVVFIVKIEDGTRIPELCVDASERARMHAWQGYVVRIRCCGVQRGGRLVSTEEGTEEGSANGIETLRRSGNVGQG